MTVIDEIGELHTEVWAVKGRPNMVPPTRSLTQILERLGDAAGAQRRAVATGDQSKKRDTEFLAMRRDLKAVAVEAIRAIESLDGSELAAYFRQTATTPEGQ